MLAFLASWFIPGGPILSAIATAMGAILTFLAKLLAGALDGLTKMVANPATFITAGLIALAAYAGGIHRGIWWDAHLVTSATEQRDAARKERDALQANLAAANAEITQWKGRLNEQETRASAAETARTVAEGKVAGALAARDRAQRLLKPAGGDPKAGPQTAAGPGLQSFQALFSGTGK